MRLGPVAIALLFAVACTRGVAFQVELRCQADHDCPSLSACYGGQCSDSCPAACGEGEVCLAARCLPVSCGDRPCHSGQACLQGACVAADCASVACQAGQTCAKGACYPTDCAGLACLAGEICWHQDDCRTSLCQGVLCGASETCADGRCVPTVCAGVVCPDGSACEGGRCQEVRCIGVSCGAGTFCADGRCVPQGCQGVRSLCDDGDECTTDTCQPDGTCSHVANTGPCDDRDPFTSPDQCSAITGTCNGVKVIYRSVGPGRAAALAAGAGNPLTIVGKMASFASALPDDVGVGDVVQYDADGDAAVDALAVIHERFSATAFQVVDVSGAMPKPTSAADQKWEIFRAYTSASDALVGRGKENPGIASSLLPFETWTRKKDLVAANEQLRIACYADGSDRTAVVVGGDVGSNWVTGPANYIELYTPVSASEVGTSQRHAGRWDATKYRLEPSTVDKAVAVWVHYFRVDGLQVGSQGHGIYLEDNTINPDTPNRILISDNIVRYVGAGFDVGIYDYTCGTYGLGVWNNVVYGFTDSGIQAYTVTPALVFHNTVVDCATGIYGQDTGITARGNIVAGCTWGFRGPFTGGGASDYNVSDASDASPNTVFAGGYATPTFVDRPNHDYHLAPGDLAAKDQGPADCATEPDLPVAFDVDGEPRPAGARCDIGADEAGP